MSALCLVAVAFAVLSLPVGLPVPAAPRSDGIGTPSASQTGANATPDTQTGVAATSESAYAPGEVLVTLAEGADVAALERELTTTPGLAGTSVVRQVTDSVVKVALPETLPIKDATARMQAVSAVKYAEPNYILETQEPVEATPAEEATAQIMRTSVNATAGLIAGTTLGDALGVQALSAPNDPYYSQQWALPSVNALAAWENATTSAVASNPSVTVAAIDASFLTSHEELVGGNVAATYDARRDTEKIDPSKVSSAYQDKVTHGTHVAGIISANTNNSKGVAGLAYNTGRVLPIAAGDEKGGMTVEALLDAYQYIEEHQRDYNIRIVNMSIGMGRQNPISRTTDSMKALYEGIEKARAEYGIITVVAACNNGTNSLSVPFHALPSDYDNVISVINLRELSASEKTGSSDDVTRAASSNYNTSDQIAKNIAAPGTSIYSLSSASASSYTLLTGTSMAAPVVSGVVALMLKAQPDLTPAEVMSKLYSSARDLKTQGWDAETGFGEVDAAAATSATTPYLSGDPLFHDVTGLWSRQFSVEANGAQQQSDAYRWTSSNPAVATVSQAGVVTAVADGRAIIAAEKDGVKAVQVVTVDGWPAYTLSGPSEIDWNTSTSDATFTARVNGVADSATNWAWASSDASIATVSSAGAVTGLASGTVTISATRKAGDEVLSQQVTVKVPTLAGASSVQAGSTAALTLKDGTTTISATGWAFSSSNTAVAAVDASGVVTGKAAGSAMITAARGAVSVKKAIAVTQQTTPSPSGTTSASGSTSASSSGSASSTASTSSTSSTSTASSTRSTSTTSSTSSASSTSATSSTRSTSASSTSSATSSSASSSSGSSSSPKLQSIENYEVTLSATRFTYTGSPTVPAVKSVSPALSATDFTVTYVDSAGSKVTPRAVGTYRVVLTGKEDRGYTGTTSATFSIVKAANPMIAKLTTPKKVVKASAVKKGQKSYKLISVKNAQGKVRYQKATGSQLGLKTNGQVIVRKKMSKGTYKIRITVYTPGNASYLPAAKTLTAKVRVK